MEIKNVLVIGTGIMGGGIANVFAQSGFNVELYDTNSKQIEKAINEAAYRLNRKVEKKAMTAEARDDILSRLNGTSSLAEAVPKADLIIEAITENQELKVATFREVDKYVRPDAYVASNTSTLSITQLSVGVTNKANFIGMHFFAPVPVMRLLELVVGLATSEETIAMAREIGKKLGKVVIVAQDSPGFIANRMIDVMSNEACFLYMEGAVPEDIDAALVYGTNGAMGPMEGIDMSGVDTFYYCMKEFYRAFADSKYRPAPILEKMVAVGWLGRKTGKGFYEYDEKGNKLPSKRFLERLKKEEQG